MANRGITVLGDDGLVRTFRLIDDAIGSREVLEEVGQFLVFSIKERTLEGKDIENRDFRPYSPGYALFRRKKGLPSDHVDLFFTGSMLNSLDVKVSGDSVKVFFAPGTDKSGASNPAKAFFLQQDRQFFGFTESDVDRVLELFNAEIRGAMRRGRQQST